MKTEFKVIVTVILTSIIIAAAIVWLITVRNQSPTKATPTANAPVVVQTNAPAPPSQIDLLAAEVRALKAANEEREARVQRLLALNEEVQRERTTNTTIIPVTVIVSNSTPAVIIQGTLNALNVGNSSAQPSAPAQKATKPAKKTLSSPKAQTQSQRVPMYTITNSTSSVRVSGTNTVSETNTSVQNFLHPGRRSLLGVILGGRSNPIPTDTPSGESVQQGRPPTPVVVVQQPYGYGYQYGGYASPYQPVYGGYGSSERRLFGVHFHTR